MASIKHDKEYKDCASCVRVYFPQNGDTLWSVAKKYHISKDKITSQNALSDDSLDGVKSLLI